MKSPVNVPKSLNPRVPEPKAPFFHSTAVQIRFNDVDMLGHLNNNIYFTFMDLAKARYFNDIAGHLVNWGEINMAVVNINANFYAPSFIDSKLEVLTSVIAVSLHSLTMEQRVVDIETGEVKCSAITIMAGYDVKTASSLPIENKWREAIYEWEERELPQHAR